MEALVIASSTIVFNNSLWGSEQQTVLSIRHIFVSGNKTSVDSLITTEDGSRSTSSVQTPDLVSHERHKGRDDKNYTSGDKRPLSPTKLVVHQEG